MASRNRRSFSLSDVQHYMRRYLPRLVELGQSTPNITKNVARDLAAARALMKEVPC